MYQREMHDNVGFFATWLPGDRIEIGDAGVFVGGRFRKMSSLKELGIEYTIEKGPTTQELKYTATSGVKLQTAAGAGVTTLGKAEISVEFSQAGSFVFHASGLQQVSIKERQSVAKQLLTAIEQKAWQMDWFLVESLRTTERATIIVSEESSGGIVLDAHAQAPLPGISLADPHISLNIRSMHGKIVHVIGEGGLHPLYSCLQMRRKFFGIPKLQPVRGVDAGEEAFTRAGIGALLES